MTRKQAALTAAGIAALVGLSSWAADVTAFQQWERSGGQTPPGFWEVAPHLWDSALLTAALSAGISIVVYLITSLTIRDKGRALAIGTAIQAGPAALFVAIMAFAAAGT